MPSIEILKPWTSWPAFHPGDDDGDGEGLHDAMSEEIMLASRAGKLSAEARNVRGPLGPESL